MKINIPDPIPRIYKINDLIKPNKVVAIFGPRRSGKTTLVKEYLKTYSYPYRYDTGDDISLHEILGSQRLSVLQDYVGRNKLIAIDEAHLIPNIGINLKLMVDNIPDIRILITGSSSIDLSNQIGEPLVGRKLSFPFFPVSIFELKKITAQFEINKLVEKNLIYGSYPEILLAKTNESKIKLLSEITNSYLFKDILIFEGVKNSKTLLNLLRLIAFQIGSEVSLTELASSLNIDKKTVARYLDLFEKSYIIFNLRGYSRNLRSEVTKKSKYYFYDNGVRNTIVSNFSDLGNRTDLGSLWENFLVIERLKTQTYKNIYGNNYFWRTWEGKEIDWIEERNGKLFAFEFKYSKPKKTNFFDFKKIYNEAVTKVITKDNYLDFLL